MIDTFEAVKVIEKHRNNAIVVAAMSAEVEWTRVSKNSGLDIKLTGTMGKASSVGLGYALAKPQSPVIILDGDGSLLMNLGSLVTIANMAPRNLVHFVFENSVYRATGGQPIPNAGRFSFAALAKAAGYPNGYEYDNVPDLEKNIESVLTQNGPTFVCLKIPQAAGRPPFPEVIPPDMLAKFKNPIYGKG